MTHTQHAASQTVRVNFQEQWPDKSWHDTFTVWTFDHNTTPNMFGVPERFAARVNSGRVAGTRNAVIAD